MLTLRLFLLLFAFSIFMLSQAQSIPVDWRSSMNLSSPGFLFSSINLPVLFLSTNTVPSLLSCARLCHSNDQCRIFDYDPSSRQCRLFEGDIATMGSSIPSSSSSQSRVGSMKIEVGQFMAHGQGCSACVGSRYLGCVNSSCQCPAKTFFDGSICQSQKLAGDQCSNSSECRGDLNYACQLNMTCGEGSPPLPTAAVTIVGGLANGSSGSSLSALSAPAGIALGSDQSLYVADSLNHRVIKLSAGYFVASMVAGTGIAGSSLNQLNTPTGVYVDSSFNLYVVDSNNYRVMLWLRNASAGIRIAGTGSLGSTLSSIADATGLYVDSQGYLFVSDTNNHRILRWAPNATSAVMVAGTGISGGDNQSLNFPCGIDFDEANAYLYVADSGNHRIQRFTVGFSTAGTTVAGGYGAGSAANQFSSPQSVYASRTSNKIYITDSGNSRIQLWVSQTFSGTTIVGMGATNANYFFPMISLVDVKLSSDEAWLFASETAGNRVWRFKLV